MRTDQGQVRDHNEDFVAYREPADAGEERKNGWLYVVADGVGGADAGEIASQYATERTIFHYLAAQNESNWGERLRQAMRLANSDLRQMVAKEYKGARMATTMVAVVIHEKTADIANVGDSRGYYWRDGEFSQVTKDQSLVARLLEEEAITEDEALHHPRRNVILHSLGSENEPKVDLYKVKLAAGEKLFLCSDGLTRHVSDEEIAAVVSEETPDEATQILIALANERGGEDNISAAVLQFGGWTVETLAGAGATAELDSSERIQKEDARRHKILWIYTAFLAIVQTVLIVLIWILIFR